MSFYTNYRMAVNNKTSKVSKTLEVLSDQNKILVKLIEVRMLIFSEKEDLQGFKNLGGLSAHQTTKPKTMKLNL